MSTSFDVARSIIAEVLHESIKEYELGLIIKSVEATCSSNPTAVKDHQSIEGDILHTKDNISINGQSRKRFFGHRQHLNSTAVNVNNVTDDEYTFNEEITIPEKFKSIKRQKTTDSIKLVQDIMQEVLEDSFKEYTIGCLIQEAASKSITNSEEDCESEDMEKKLNYEERRNCVGNRPDSPQNTVSDLNLNPDELFSCIFICVHCQVTFIDNHDQILKHKCHCFEESIEKCCSQCNLLLGSVIDLKNHSADYHHGRPVIEFKSNSGICAQDNTSIVTGSLKDTKNDYYILNANFSCSPLCETRKCSQISIEKLRSVTEKLNCLRKSELHQFLLKRLEMQNELGIANVFCFIIDKQSLCTNALQTLGVSKYMLDKVIAEFQSGKVNYVHGNKGVCYDKRKRDIMISFTHQFAQDFAENLPDRTVLQLPSYLNIKEIFINYTESVKVEDQVSERSFYYIFKNTFGDNNRTLEFLPRIVFLPRHTHPKCNECDRINVLRQTAKTEVEKMHAESLKRRHMINIRRKYLNFTYRRELASRYPSDYLHIGMDDIGQDSVLSPYQRVNTKSGTGLLRLNNHMTGVIVTNGSLPAEVKYFNYLNNDQFPNDSNKVRFYAVTLNVYVISFSDNFYFVRHI